MRRYLVLLGLLLAPLAACERKVAAGDQRPGAEVRLPQGVIPIRYEVTITPDMAGMRFRGSAKINVQVGQPTSKITLNAADLEFDRVVLEDGSTARISLDERRETATFTFPNEVATGRHDLLIDYRGQIRTSASGLFAQDYQDEAGRDRRLLATQFQSTDYRRFAPSWDEPGVKAVFQTTVVVPADVSAVSNMPASRTTAMTGGLKRIEFQPTPKMSSYLNFLALGDLERVSRKVGNVEIGVVMRRGITDRAAFALHAGSELLRWYDQYFGMDYPLPKLDLVAVPGSGSFGAMENWGAILFFEPYVLTDPRLSTEADRQRAYIYIAHEIAHQWFGNLVTMAWWDDLWLNESFASWMENKATAAIHPEWNRDLDMVADRDKAMRLDAGAGTHPVVQPAETMEQVNHTGDAITYEKGAAVIRMLEAFIGPEAFRSGVQAYLKRFAYANATRDDLWRALEGASSKPVVQIARDFTLQAGVPLISVEPVGAGAATLRQGRFGLDPGSKEGRAWRVPVVLSPIRGGQPTSMIVSASAPGRADIGSGPLLVNLGQTGYFRTLYSQNGFAALATVFGDVSGADQLGLITDSWALGAAGYEPVANVLELISRLPEDADPKVWTGALRVLDEIDGLYAQGPDRQAFRAWAIGRLRPLMEAVTWEARAGDSPGRRILRQALITQLGVFAEPDVVQAAREQFDVFQADPAALDADRRAVVLNVIGRNATPAEFEQLRALARRATDPQEKRAYLEALAAVSDRRLAARVLEMTATTEAPANIATVLITIVADQHPELAFERAVAQQAELDQRLDASLRQDFYARLLAASADTRAADRLRAFAQRAYSPAARQTSNVAEATIRYRAQVRAQRLPEIDRWLELARAAAERQALREAQVQARREAEARRVAELRRLDQARRAEAARRERRRRRVRAAPPPPPPPAAPETPTPAASDAADPRP
jgi:aminopeptidase N